jgi:hypothetical protein
MAWAQTVLTGFERNNWTVRDGWTLDLVTGHLDFEATYREAQVTDVPGGKLVTAPAGVDFTPSAEGIALIRRFESLSADRRDLLLHGEAVLYYTHEGWMVR